MPSFEQFLPLFSSLYSQWAGHLPTTVVPLAGSGSQRLYVRITSDESSVIGTFSNNTEENDSFIYLSGFLKAKGFSVPEVLLVSNDRTAYLQEDFGDESLFGMVQLAWYQGSFNDSVIRLYEDAISSLIRFQLIAPQGLDFSRCYPAACFDEAAIKDDLNYFRYYFLKMHPIEVNETRLSLAFDALTKHLMKIPPEHFMYRDFQSRNIMVRKGKLHFIDFQGARKGPLPYDLVSLLYQVKARIPAKIRKQLLAYYLDELKKHGIADVSLFEETYPYFVYLRLLQVLGAYGYRGIIQRKPHFLESIPYALETLEQHLSLHPLPPDCHYLQEILAEVTTLPYPFPKVINRDGEPLLLRIRSFSFKKKGIPEDETGNGGGFVFDCRSLPNPGRETQFKMLTGRSKEVIAFLEEKPEVAAYLNHVYQLIDQAVSDYKERRFADLMVSFGCTGGQHRSVYCAEKLSHYMRKIHPDIKIQLRHCEMDQQT